MNNRKSYYAINLSSYDFNRVWYMSHYSQNCCQTSVGKLPHTVFDTEEETQKALNSFREWCPKYAEGAKIVSIRIDSDI